MNPFTKFRGHLGQIPFTEEYPLLKKTADKAEQIIDQRSIRQIGTKDYDLCAAYAFAYQTLNNKEIPRKDYLMDCVGYINNHSILWENQKIGGG